MVSHLVVTNLEAIWVIKGTTVTKVTKITRDTMATRATKGTKGTKGTRVIKIIKGIRAIRAKKGMTVRIRQVRVTKEDKTRVRISHDCRTTISCWSSQELRQRNLLQPYQKLL